MSEPFETHVPDPDDPPSEQELLEAERLRAALARGVGEEAELAESLRVASRSAEISAVRHEELLARALSANVTNLAGARASKRRALGAVGITTLLAAAAAVALVVRLEPRDQVARTAPPSRVPAVSRTTAGLFEGQFPVSGGTTERVDRIAAARQQDLRENLYLAWGVR